MTASNESFSPPVQVPRMWTVPPIFDDDVLLPHAVTPRTTIAIAARIRVSLPIGLLPPFGRDDGPARSRRGPRDPCQRVYDRTPALSNPIRRIGRSIRKY